MRRSVRDAIVGFSLVGGVVIFSSLTLWLKGINIKSNSWTINAAFSDASGLSEGTPVTFRGIKIGNVQKINFTPQDIRATIRINKKSIIIFKPITAKVETSSLLGGDVQISLISKGNQTEKITYLPKQKDCSKELILCEGDLIKGGSINNISKLTSDLNKFLDDADDKNLLNKMVASIEQFDETQKHLDELVRLTRKEVLKTKPILEDLRKSAQYMRNILDNIDDPEVLGDIKSSTKSIKSLTERIDKISYKVNEILDDEELTNAFKDAAIGIGRLFNDIYN